jgi:hypothetical protein
MSLKSLLFGVVVLLLAAGCSSKTRTVRVAVPPRVNLAAYPLVGLVTFTSNAKGELDRLAAQKFLQAVQSAQPGTRVIELGPEAHVLASVNARSWDAATFKAIKEKHGVDVLVMGRLDVERARPDFNLSTVVKKLSVRADVNASLNARLLETNSGATMWSDGSQLTTNVAHARFNDRGEGHFGASDPEAAYGEMVDALVWEVTDDFREHYVTRRVRKDDPAYASVAD